MIESSRYASLEELDLEGFDGVIFSVGTELRSIQVFEKCHGLKIKSAAFIHNKRTFFEERSASKLGDADIDLQILGGSVYLNAQHEGLRDFLSGVNRVLVDVSCMTRSMMAELTIYLFEYSRNGLSVEFIYLPSKFSTPSKEYPKIRNIGAAAPQFSGYNFNPGYPVALALGLGHEFGVAVGILNQMEPRMSVCFRSVGIDERFDDAVRDGNLDFEFGPFSPSLVDVDITNPRHAFDLMENIFANLMIDHRLIVIPSGPKIFSIISILIALKHLGHVAIFRVEHARMLTTGIRSTDYISFRMQERFGIQEPEDGLFVP